MDLIFSSWLVWFLAGVAIMLAELALPGFVIIFFGLGCWVPRSWRPSPQTPIQRK